MHLYIRNGSPNTNLAPIPMFYFFSKIKIGKFSFRALGKSLADGNHDGFVKVIYDEKYGELLGCHIIGHAASNLISEVGLARTLETTYHEVLKTIHPHPTLSEAINEATADALDEAIHT